MTPIVIEKRNGHRQNDHVGYQQYEHDQVPVEAKVGARMNDPVTHFLLSHLFLEHTLATAKQLHGQLVVRRLEHADHVGFQIRIGRSRLTGIALFVRIRTVGFLVAHYFVLVFYVIRWLFGRFFWEAGALFGANMSAGIFSFQQNILSVLIHTFTVPGAPF